MLSPFVFRHADKILVQSPKINDELQQELIKAGYFDLGKVVKEKASVIPNGIALKTAQGGAGKAVLFVGRLVGPKGVKYLIEAMRQCREERLLIVGDGPEMARLKQAAHGMANVQFVGRVAPEAVRDYIRQAEVLVLPSVREEGTPNVILEAMAEGVPVIASRIAGIPIS